MSSIRELRNLVLEPDKLTGDVVSISGTLIKVLTGNGISVVSRGSMADIAVGDNVILNNGVLVGRIQREDLLQTYFI